MTTSGEFLRDAFVAIGSRWGRQLTAKECDDAAAEYDKACAKRFVPLPNPVDLERAREIYFSLGGLESDIGPRKDTNWYWRRAAKMAWDQIEGFRSDAEAWRKGWATIRELQERVIPCGHKIEDLIGGEGDVTKCGACLAERQSASCICGQCIRGQHVTCPALKGGNRGR